MGGGKGRGGQETPIFLRLILKFRTHSDPAGADSLRIPYLQTQPTASLTVTPSRSARGTVWSLTGVLRCRAAPAASHVAHVSG